jgi:putative SOS response-associated peptidase YedK
VCQADHYIRIMCGRVIQSSGPLRYAMVDGMNVRGSRVHNYPPRWNGAPSQELLVIRRNHKTGEVSLDPLRWGLIPCWCRDPAGGHKPINAKCETVGTLPTFVMRTACAAAFYRWTASTKEPGSGEWIRTFVVITTDANELVAEIHHRMPAILAPADYARWLSDEPDPHDLMLPSPADQMRMWPISTRVNKPENDDRLIVEPIEVAKDAA